MKVYYTSFCKDVCVSVFEPVSESKDIAGIPCRSAEAFADTIKHAGC